MKHKGKLILKYFGENYETLEVTLPIEINLGERPSMVFDFEFPGSTTKEKVEFTSLGNNNKKAILQPYGIDFMVVNSTCFLMQFQMVEELIDDDAEMFIGVAKFDATFPSHYQGQELIYHF